MFLHHSRRGSGGGLQEYVDEIGSIRNFCLHVREVEYISKSALKTVRSNPCPISTHCESDNRVEK